MKIQYEVYPPVKSVTQEIPGWRVRKIKIWENGHIFSAETIAAFYGRGAKRNAYKYAKERLAAKDGK